MESTKIREVPSGSLLAQGLLSILDTNTPLLLLPGSHLSELNVWLKGLMIKHFTEFISPEMCMMPVCNVRRQLCLKYQWHLISKKGYSSIPTVGWN